MMQKRIISFLIVIGALFMAILPLSAQVRIITVPQKISGAPFKVADSGDLFGKAYRWFIENETEMAADSLRELLSKTPGLNFDEKNNYYIIIADYGDHFAPMGMLHEGSSFYDTRLFGLTGSDLYYVFISKQKNAESFLSVTLTTKSSPFEAGLLDFINLFPILSQKISTEGDNDVWVDVRKFQIPEVFQKNCDISLLVKRSVDAENFLAANVFDNTSKERWSFGIITALTNLKDVELAVGGDGRIIVIPNPYGDFATYGALNYHFKPVDTKQPNVASSWHLAGGFRLTDHIEPIFGVGFGLPADLPIEVHFFGGFSVAFVNQLKSGFKVGDDLAAKGTEDIDPFNTKVRFRLRYGIELKFP